MANIYSDIKGKVKKYEPLMQANREFLILSQSITGNAPSPRLRSKQIALLLFTRAATIFEGIQQLAANLKTIEGFILLRSLFEISAYLHYIWSGGINSKAEREKRAELYGSWEFIEDKKLLDIIKEGGAPFYTNIQNKFLASEKSINQNYQQFLCKYPELADKHRRKRDWHGLGSLENLVKKIDESYRSDSMQRDYNSLIRGYHWAVHSGIKSTRDNLVVKGRSRVYKYGGNEEHMFRVLLTSFLIYKSFVTKLIQIFGTGIKLKVRKFEKERFNPVVEHLKAK